MKNFLKHIFTEADNRTFDHTRVYFGLAFLVFIGGAIYLICSDKFDLMTFATATAAFLMGGAGGTAIKNINEGPATDKPEEPSA